MNASLSVSAFRKIADDLAAIEQVIAMAENLLEDATRQGTTLPQLHSQIGELRSALHTPADSLRERIKQVSLIYNTFSQFGNLLTASEVANLTLDAVWQRASLSFAAMILGETELGPYRYQSLRGIPDGARYLGKECLFPLWGTLARALVRRLSADESDYLVINDIRADNSPKPEEFPWMPRSGSVLLVPLRIEERSVGALVLGQNQPYAFRDPQLCDDYHDLANLAARALYHTQLRQEINERDGQLVGLQLFMKSMTSVHSLGQLLTIVGSSLHEMMGQVTAHLVLERELSVTPAQRQPNHTTFNLHAPASGSQRIVDRLAIYALSRDDGGLPLTPDEPVLGLIEWAMQAGQPVFYEPDGLLSNPKDLYYNQAGRGLVVPIFGDTQIIGAIHIAAPLRTHQFEESDMVVVRTIANSIAVALATVVSLKA